MDGKLTTKAECRAISGSEVAGVPHRGIELRQSDLSGHIPKGLGAVVNLA